MKTCRTGHFQGKTIERRSGLESYLNDQNEILNYFMSAILDMVHYIYLLLITITVTEKSEKQPV
jgi:hypothetical protein